MTPFAGMASFFAWLGALGFAKRVAEVMSFEYRSPNAIAPEQTLLAFMSAVVVGASRFAHAGWLRHDKAFHALLGVERFPSEDAIRRFFNRFTQARIEVFLRPLWRWMLARSPVFNFPRPEGSCRRRGGRRGRCRCGRRWARICAGGAMGRAMRLGCAGRSGSIRSTSHRPPCAERF